MFHFICFKSKKIKEVGSLCDKRERRPSASGSSPKALWSARKLRTGPWRTRTQAAILVKCVYEETRAIDMVGIRIGFRIIGIHKIPKQHAGVVLDTVYAVACQIDETFMHDRLFNFSAEIIFYSSITQRWRVTCLTVPAYTTHLITHYAIRTQ